MRTNVYVDGFNLYYGCLKGSRYKWLDIVALCRAALQRHHVLHRVRYFTARVTPRPNNPQLHNRQQAYIRALETLPNVTVHYGAFLSHERERPLAPRSTTPGGPRTTWIIETNEKGSDVNLASYLLLDGFRADYEAAVVISNDSDLATPIRLVRDEFKLPVGLLNPHPKPAVELKKVAKYQVAITATHLAASQFAPLLTDAGGRSIAKPARW